MNILRTFLILIYLLIALIVWGPLLIVLRIKSIRDKFPFLSSSDKFINRINDQVIKFLQPDKTKVTISEGSKQNAIKDNRPEAIKGIPNMYTGTYLPFLERECLIIYYEPYYAESVNQFIVNNYEEIRKESGKKGYQFVYLGRHNNISGDQFEELINFFFPAYIKAQQDYGFYSGLQSSMNEYYSILNKLLFLDEVTMPCLIKIYGNAAANPYPIYLLPDDDHFIADAFKYYFQTTSGKGTIQMRVDDRYIEDDIQNEPIKISEDVYTHIETIINKHKSNGAISLIIKIIGELEKVNALNDPRLSHVAQIFAHKNPKALSPLLVRRNGDLYFVDYDVTIELTPLQKTVYIFFLLHPEGILFKELPSYRNQLEKIYLKVSSRTDLETMKKSIADLVNPHTNSMSEKSSKIKEVFMKKFTSEIAVQYFINGQRTSRKKVAIDRKFVTFEEPF